MPPPASMMMMMPQMGPIKEFLALLASASATVKVWLDIRDRFKALAAGKEAYVAVENDKSVDRTVEELSQIIPEETWKLLNDRLRVCGDRFNEMLSNPEKYFPDQIAAATTPLKRCICETLNMIVEVYGKLPLPAQQKLWNLYDCPVLLKPKRV